MRSYYFKFHKYRNYLHIFKLNNIKFPFMNKIYFKLYIISSMIRIRISYQLGLIRFHIYIYIFPFSDYSNNIYSYHPLISKLMQCLYIRIIHLMRLAYSRRQQDIGLWLSLSLKEIQISEYVI